METVTKSKGKSVKVKRTVRKKSKLSELIGCFKGQFFYDEAIFNLGVRP